MTRILTTLLFIVLLPLPGTLAQTPDPTDARRELEETHEKKDRLRKMIRQRTFPSGQPGLFGRYLSEMVHYREQQPASLAANWIPVDASGSLNNDIGRTASITIDTVNPGHLYVCTPHSGVWMTTDNGLTYTPITESMPTQNTSFLAIDPFAPGTLYLATGTHQMDMPPNSMGVFKTTDSGANWNPTGLTFSPADGIAIGDLILNPQNTSSILAATTTGLYRSFDSGATWNKILNDAINSVRYHPSDTTILYAIGTTFYRSTDGGNTFASNMNNIQTGFQWNYQWFVRTTRAQPDIVYVFTAGGWANPGFNTKFYIHKSTDSGMNFTLLDSLAGEVAGQFDAAQQTVDRFITGYWRVYLKDGSAPFQQISQSNTSPGLPYMHVDQRGISFHPQNDSIIYFCNDGGLYRTTDKGQSIQTITQNMSLAHIHDFAHSQNTGKKILVAPLDVPPYIIGNNGISNTFTQFSEAFATDMSPVNDHHYFIIHQTPLFTTSNWGAYYNSSHPLIGNVYFSKNALQYDECDENICYFSSWNDLYKSQDAGASFGNFVRTTYNPVNGFFKSPEGFTVARSNPRYVYIYYEDSVYLTTNGSNPMTNITGNLPVSSALISHLTVDPTDENKVWVSFSGYDAGNKVFQSTDAGQTWVNISQGLPNIPVSELIVQPGVPGAVYAGSDGGVFYRDQTFSSWQYYNAGLPNVIITGVDMQYNEGKIRISTFGRGIWESDLYQPTPANYVLPPVSIFTVAQPVSCAGALIQPENLSCGVVDSVQWLFPGGTPAASADYQPTVSYNTPGYYSITLITYNSGGSDTLTLTDVLYIEPPVPVPYLEPVADLNLFELPQGMWAEDKNDDDLTWNRGWWTDGSAGPGDDFLYYDNFHYQYYGLEEPLHLPAIDLSGTVAPKLFFYRSYKTRDPLNHDTLKVVARACGGTDTLLYIKGGNNLATVSGIQPGSSWVPGLPSHWAPDSVDLSAFAGEAAVNISLINRSGFGQVLYIDDFRIIETSSTGLTEEPDIHFELYPNPATDEIHIRSFRHPISSVSLRDVTGRLLRSEIISNTHTVAIDLSGAAPGVYLVEVNNRVTKKVVKR